MAYLLISSLNRKRKDINHVTVMEFIMAYLKQLK